KTGFQSVWAGASFFWFFAAAVAEKMQWTGAWWRYFAMFNGIVATVALIGAVALTLYSLALYARRYGYILGSSAREAGRERSAIRYLGCELPHLLKDCPQHRTAH